MRKKLNCILLVDDDSEDNYFHQIVINDMDAANTVQVAQNGLEALEFLTKENQIAPELIFLDINMPKMNGWEFLEAYQKLNANQRAKVVVAMLTTSMNPADQKRAEKFPEIASFNSKPLTEPVLADILKRYFPDNL